ncbi:pyridoxal-dependent decarboxylase [Aspergillus ambiguus]|uniref:type III PLP-dependent enzyme n=1 Tax=Aspergillus ambiguus TaxID=176160 RepID=UPI003CCCBEC7
MTATEVRAENCCPDQLVENIISRRICDLDQNSDDIRHDLPFVVADTKNVYEIYQRWVRCLPNVLPHYAVKCNPDVYLLRYLANLGVNFDCASFSEIKLVLDLGIDPARILFAHPCKAVSALRLASARGVQHTTFDNLDELDKIKQHAPGIRLLLRIYASDPAAAAGMGEKYGAPLHTTGPLLERARALGLDVEGVSFHIGSGARNADAFITAIQEAKCVFQNAKRLGFHMRILDVGGGFQDSNFEKMASRLRLALEKEISSSIKIVAEPGRLFARSFYTMACKVISRRTQPRMDVDTTPQVDKLYLNDGMYGGFLNSLTEQEVFIPELVQRGVPHEERRKGLHRYSLWGPTCDGIDCIRSEVTMDREIKVGDWLKFKNMGGESY